MEQTLCNVPQMITKLKKKGKLRLGTVTHVRDIDNRLHKVQLIVETEGVTALFEAHSSHSMLQALRKLEMIIVKEETCEILSCIKEEVNNDAG